MTPRDYAQWWRAHWEALADAQAEAASGRVSYSPEETDILVGDAVKGLGLEGKDALLDIGCAKGLMRRGLAFHCQAYVGLDYVEAFGPDVVGDARRLPFRDHTFDKVLLSGVLVCIPPEWHGEVLDEMYRVTRHGGRAFVSHNPHTFVHEMAHVFHPGALCRQAELHRWARARITSIDPRLEQAPYYFDMVLYRDS